MLLSGVPSKQDNFRKTLAPFYYSHGGQEHTYSIGNLSKNGCVFVSQGRQIHFSPSLDVFLSFLLKQFRGNNEGVPLGYSAMNTLRSAVSSVADIAGKPTGQYPLVKRFMRAVLQNRPALPRYNYTWDPDVVLNYIKLLGPNRTLTVSQLVRKSTVLLLLLSGRHGQVLHVLDIRNMFLTSSRVSFQIVDLLKTSRPGHNFSQLIFKAYAPDRCLCVITTLHAYLQRMSDIRGDINNLLVTTRKPFKAASLDTIRRWTRDMMRNAGIDLQVFAPHSTRAAASSKALCYLLLHTIIKSVGWSNSSVFATYYKKPFCSSNIQDGVLTL